VTDRAPTFSFSIDLPIRSEWANVDLLRTSVQNCFTAVFSDIDGCQALAMVTGELLENAIKYGDWSGDQGGEFRLRVWGEAGRGAAPRSAHVCVENPVDAGGSNVRAVLATLEWLKGFASAKDAYRAKLLEIAEAAGNMSASGLGLVRIAYEGNCTLRAEVGGRMLKVTADTTF
jgi:two-component sensor histidine kinase